MTYRSWMWLIVLLGPTAALAQPMINDPLAVLRRELESMLDASGLPIDPTAALLSELGEIARQSGQVAAKLANADQNLEARLIQTRAYNALAQDAIRRDSPDIANLRLIQMRSTADKARQIDTPQAQWAGDTWLLMADLIEGNRNANHLREQQASAMAQLGRFVSMHRDNELAQESPAMLQVKLNLLRLYDQAGENARAMELMEQLLERMDPDDERAADFASIAASAALVSQPLDVSLRSTNRDDKLFTLLLIGQGEQDPPFDPDRNSTLMIREVKVDADHPADTLAQGLGGALPCYVIIDPAGIIAAVGHSSAILDRLIELRIATPIIHEIDVQD